MRADEIRTFFDQRQWSGSEVNALYLIYVELAAQLAELNDSMKELTMGVNNLVRKR